MKKTLEGSCHCGAVQFSLDSTTQSPYQRCYCSICRKTNGGGGYAINIMGEADTLLVTGEENINIYFSSGAETNTPIERHFCGKCGSGLWVFCKKWPELIHPFASTIDTPLPVPDHTVHIMTDSAAQWVTLETGDSDKCFSEYPEQSIADWHEKVRRSRK